jgi:hypothetical protein
MAMRMTVTNAAVMKEGDRPPPLRDDPAGRKCPTVIGLIHAGVARTAAGKFLTRRTGEGEEVAEATRLDSGIVLTIDTVTNNSVFRRFRYVIYASPAQMGWAKRHYGSNGLNG